MLMRNRRRSTQTVTFPGPVRGWIKNASLSQAPVDGAEVLDNWFPTTQGARIRNGKEKHATVTGTIEELIVYRSGSTEKLFAATETDIYDVTTPADPDVSPSADVTSLTSGDWSYTQFANPSGEYVVIANGADAVRHYNGTTWATPSITGVTSSNLSQVWTFKERLFFIEENTLSFWYLPVNAIAGAATEFPLQGIFHLGGALLFGATWSVDSGSGQNDQCVFVTTEGEIAVYQGSDPSATSTWSLVGVYRMGRPLDKNGWIKSGGDLLILTEDGVIPLSEALQRDRDKLQEMALSYPIEDAWRNVIAGRSASYDFSITLWPTKTQLFIGTPSQDGGLDVCFVANSRTNAWARYTGWELRCGAVVDDQFYFGSLGPAPRAPDPQESIVYKGEKTGNDDGVAYNAKWVPKFYEDGPLFKTAIHARFRGRASEAYNFALNGNADYTISSFPSVNPAGEENDDTWGSGTWGTSTWGGLEDKNFVSTWRAVRGGGSALAPGISVPCNRTTANTLEAIALDLMMETGSML